MTEVMTLSDVGSSSELAPGEARCPGPTVQEIVRRDDRPPPPVLLQESYRFLGSDDIPVERYFDEEFFKAEMKSVWSKVWQWACRVEHIPETGDNFVYEIGPYSVFIVRAPSGIRAYVNSCLHRATKFRPTEGEGYSSKIRCPFHGWTWTLEGQLESIPCAWDFPHVDPEKANLPEVRVETWGGFVFINLDPEARPLREFMAPIDDHFADWTFDNLYVELHVAKELPANWKAVRESFMEAYHSPTTHPQLMRTVIDVNTQYDIFSDHVSRFYATLGVPSPLLENPPTDRELVAEMLTGGVGLGGEAEVPEDCQLREGETARSVLSRFQRRRLRETYDVDVSRYSDSEVIDGIQYGLFPNMTLWPGFALPLVYRVRPIGMDVERSLLEVLWLRPIPENGERPEPAEPYHLGVDDSFTTVPGIDQAFADTFDQDTEILASQQKGFKVSTKGVTLANYQEIRLRHMHQTLDKYLNGTVEASEG